jgi:hypothetical protein
VFIRKSATGFCIILIYVNDLNIIGHTKDIDEAHNLLKTEFEMKDILVHMLEHLHMDILVHLLMSKKY